MNIEHNQLVRHPQVFHSVLTRLQSWMGLPNLLFTLLWSSHM